MNPARLMNKEYRSCMLETSTDNTEQNLSTCESLIHWAVTSICEQQLIHWAITKILNHKHSEQSLKSSEQSLIHYAMGKLTCNNKALN